MVTAMQTAIADKADGIAVCLVDAKAFNKPTDAGDDRRHSGYRLQRRLPAGSPNKRLAYVGQASTSPATTSRRNGCRWYRRAAT